MLDVDTFQVRSNQNFKIGIKQFCTKLTWNFLSGQLSIISPKMGVFEKAFIFTWASLEVGPCTRAH